MLHALAQRPWFPKTPLLLKFDLLRLLDFPRVFPYYKFQSASTSSLRFKHTYTSLLKPRLWAMASTNPRVSSSSHLLLEAMLLGWFENRGQADVMENIYALYRSINMICHNISLCGIYIYIYIYTQQSAQCIYIYIYIYIVHSAGCMLHLTLL